jgi:hypothetical protein
VEEKEALKELKRQVLGVDINTEQKAFREKYELAITSIGLRKRVDKHIEKGRFISRAYTAVFGGLAVIAPMLIMSLHPTRLTQLLTTSLFVVSVALILAWLMDDAERKDMVAATAAYAAVLAVFVGASTTTTTT